MNGGARVPGLGAREEHEGPVRSRAPAFILLRYNSFTMEDLTLLWIPAGLLFILGAVILMFLLT